MCRSFFFWNFRYKMIGKIFYGECGLIVMVSIDDLIW